MIGAKHWEDEITKRVEENISKEYYADMIIPIAFDGVWILLTFNYEKRQAQIVYFQKEVEKHDLKLLHPVADFLWREGGRMGVRCSGGAYYQEKKHKLLWRVSYVSCCRDMNEKVEKLSFKRFAGMMYEIACKKQRTVDSVVEYVADITREEINTTKMLLAEL